MEKTDIINRKLSFLERELVKEIDLNSVLSLVDKDAIIIEEGQYLKQLPILLEGNVKVYTQNDEKELLLYYIQPSQSCIISFYAAINNHPSRIFAVSEQESMILLVPATKVNGWITKYPAFNRLFFDLYHVRYLDLLETINQLIFNKMDDRILHYLRSMQLREKTEFLDLRHHQIARDLGTAREVVTRVLKRLEEQRVIKQSSSGIKILSHGDQNHHF